MAVAVQSLLVPIAETIHFPAHSFRKAGKVGRLIWNVETEGAWEVAVNEPAILDKQRAEVIKMKDGRVYLVGPSTIRSRPKEVIGHLYRKNSGALAWAWHRGTEQLSRELQKLSTRAVCSEVCDTWSGQLSYRLSSDGGVAQPGLRKAQIGALFSIGAHWSLGGTEPATVVMPTGTGKTETMLCTLVGHQCPRVLVLVPSRPLREQTVEKFRLLGHLRKLGVVPAHVTNPIVLEVKRRPKSAADLRWFRAANVIVGTVSAVAQGKNVWWLDDLGKDCTHVFIDEAHHVAANTWKAVKDHFKAIGKPILQFTATPHREDGAPIEGKIIYSYPLALAQKEGYFKRIHFRGLFEPPGEAADNAVAKVAIERLATDLAAGHDHLLMARCLTKERARVIHALYQTLAPDYKPLLIISGDRDASKKVDILKRRESRIVVCVNMLGEGFDLPQLKVAAVHDKHKSLGVLMQFAGRFTRSLDPNIAKVSDAFLVANTGDAQVKGALDKLYREDADWNELLADYSFDLVQQQTELVSFLKKAELIYPTVIPLDEKERVVVTKLAPSPNTFVYEARDFQPLLISQALDPGYEKAWCWQVKDEDTLLMMTRVSEPVDWYRATGIYDGTWTLTVVCFVRDRGLLFIGSTDKEAIPDRIAKAVSNSTAIRFSNDKIYRCLGKIDRLMLLQVGLKRHGANSRHRFTMYTGQDVKMALSASATEGSSKSVVFGMGYREGRRISIGASVKGKVWGRSLRGGKKSVPHLIAWCAHQAAWLRDDAISTDEIIKNVIVPEELKQFPPVPTFYVAWPQEMLFKPEDSIDLIQGTQEADFIDAALRVDHSGCNASAFSFWLIADGIAARFVQSIAPGSEAGFQVTQAEGAPVLVRIGRKNLPLIEYLTNKPPEILLSNGSEIHGCLHYPVQLPGSSFDDAQAVAFDWTGVNLKKESYFSDGATHVDSIQWKILTHCLAKDYDVVFDDDASGEIADVVCIKLTKSAIRLTLIHCKFSGGKDPGERAGDLLVLCGQAAKSVHWLGDVERTTKHLEKRERNITRTGRPSRFHRGTRADLQRIAAYAAYLPMEREMVIVQPGVQRTKITMQQKALLSSLDAFLRQTISEKLNLWCSE